MNKRAKAASFLASVIAASVIALSTVCAMSLVTGCSSGTSSQSGEILGVGYPAVEEPIVFAHISDTHFGGDTNLSSSDGTGSDDPEQLRYDGKALMTTLINDIVPVVNPLATVHTGDLVNEGFQLKPWESYRDVVASLSYPKYIEVSGNHDFKVSKDTLHGKDKGDGRKLFTEYSKIGRTLGADSDKYGVTSLASAYGTVHMIRTNTAESPTNDNQENIDGYFSATQQKALLKDPALDTGAYLSVVLGHHPVAGDNPIGTGRSLMLDLIANSQINAPIYLCGHLHAPKIMWAKKTLVVQADTFGRHGQKSSFYLVGYDSGIASAKLVEVNAEVSPSISWPIVMTTYPANSSLGDGGNPNAPYYQYGSNTVIVLRSMVFSPASDAVASVKYRVDQGAWQDLNKSVGRVWEGTLSLQGLDFGIRTVTVRATLSSGRHNDDQITVTIYAPPIG